MQARSEVETVSALAQQGVRRYRRRLFSVPVKLRYFDSEGVKDTRGVNAGHRRRRCGRGD